MIKNKRIDGGISREVQDEPKMPTTNNTVHPEGVICPLEPHHNQLCWRGGSGCHSQGREEKDEK